MVAPFMGAWIEISLKFNPGNVELLVAPFMGAWIEIGEKLRKLRKLRSSRPSWARGLKSCLLGRLRLFLSCRALHGRVD